MTAPALEVGFREYMPIAVATESAPRAGDGNVSAAFRTAQFSGLPRPVPAMSRPGAYVY